MNIKDISVSYENTVVGTAAGGNWDKNDNSVRADIVWKRTMLNKKPLVVRFTTLRDVKKLNMQIASINGRETLLGPA